MNGICSAEGCVRKRQALEWCNMHYQRWYRYGDPTHTRPDVLARFLAKVEKSDECWIWTGVPNTGYGRFYVNRNRKTAMAHRVSYELFVGPIPAGMEVDHICLTPLCVRPDHLRTVTSKQNNEHLSGARSGNRSGVRGVSWHDATQKWTARVGHNYQTIYVGEFNTIAEAEAAVIAKRLELFTHNELDKATEAELKLARRDGSAEWITKAAAALDALIDQIPRTAQHQGTAL